MPYCPECRAEFNADVSSCNECQVALVEEKPAESVPEWSEVRDVPRDSEATMIKGYLEAKGIPVQIENVSSHTFTETIGDLAEVRIFVPTDRLQEARALLEAEDASPDPIIDDDEIGEPLEEEEE